eukprot:gene14080-18892_t
MSSPKTLYPSPRLAIAINYQTPVTPYPATATETPKLWKKIDAVDRGITLNQLNEILFLVKRESGNWIRVKDGTSIKLCLETVTLADVKDHVVMPRTNGMCSYVEMVAEKEQTPLWMVSFWSGITLQAFIHCLEQHAKDRGLTGNDSYWISTFANNKSDDEEVELDNTSFRKALNSENMLGLISIVDEKCEVYKRIWCCYAMYIVLMEKTAGNEKKLDIYTAYSGADYYNGNFNAVGITHGFASIDEGIIGDELNRTVSKNDINRSIKSEEGVATKNYNAKAWREGYFPLDRIVTAAKFDVTKATAENKFEQERILETIANYKPKNEPYSEHPHVVFNRVVRGRFIASAFMSLFQKYGNGDELDVYYMILKESTVFHLNFLNFSGMNNFNDKAAEKLVNHLPLSIKTLQLSLRNCGIGVVGTMALYSIIELLPKLEVLEIIDAEYGYDAIDVLINSLRTRGESQHHCKFTKLVLTGNNLGKNDGGRRLSEIFQLPNSPFISENKLNLKHNNISDPQLMRELANKINIRLEIDGDGDPDVFVTPQKGVTANKPIESYKRDHPVSLKPEERGITLLQLKQVMMEINAKCQANGGKWNRKSEDGKVKISQINPDEVNLYDIKEDIIKQQTEYLKCSFVEMIAEKSQNRETKFKYDMYAAKNGVNSRTGRSFHAIGITDGVVEIDKGHSYNKVERESYFPLDMIDRISSFDVLNAKAWKNEDKIVIRNVITKHKPIQEEPKHNYHVMYERLNDSLRGRIVSSSWIQLFRSTCNTNKIRDIDYYSILRKSCVEYLHHLDFSKLSNFNDEAAKRLANSLPITLKSIGLNLHGCGIGVEGTAQLYSLPNKLLQLEEFTILNAYYGGKAISWLTDVLSSNLNKKFTYLNISSNNINAKEGSLLVKALQENKSLTELDLWGNRIEQDVIRELADVLKYRKDFNNNEKNKDMMFKELKVKNIDLILQPGARGISLAQLKEVLVEVEAEHKSWRDINKKRFSLETITVDDIVEFFILPRTEKRKCSYVETIASAAQMPKWSVILWLHLPFKSLIDCIEQHTVDRGLPSDTYYWIEPFARNCWDMRSVHYSSNLDDSLFRLALNASDGVVDVIDSNGVSFDRVWCNYDRYQALERNGKLFDIYTPLVNHISGLNESNVESNAKLSPIRSKSNSKFAGCSGDLTSFDSASNNESYDNDNDSYYIKSGGSNDSGIDPEHHVTNETSNSLSTEIRSLKAVGILSEFGVVDKNDPKAKYEREQHFPQKLIKTFLNFDITEGKTSKVEDKSVILNELGKRESGNIFDKNISVFEAINRKVRGLILVLVWTSLFRTTSIVDDQNVDVEKYYNILKESRITHIRYLDLTDVNIFNVSNIKKLVRSLPQSLKELRLRLLDSATMIPETKRCNELLFDLPLILKELEVFSIEGATYGDDCIEHLLEELNESDCLITSIRLHNCNLTSKSADMIGKALSSNKKLIELILTSNKFGEKGLIKIMDGLSPTNMISKLDLKNDKYEENLKRDLFDKLQKCNSQKATVQI